MGLATPTNSPSSRSWSLSAYAVNDVVPQRHVVPPNAAAVAAVVREANERGEALIPVGGRTRLDVGNPPHRYDIALDLTAIAGITEHEPADLTATVRAGTTLTALAAHLAAHGQRWPVEVARPEIATVGGVLSGAAPGLSRLCYAHPRDWTLGVRAVLGDGTLTKAGGKVVKNVSGYDLGRLYAGSYGTLCVLVEASLKLWPLPQTERVIVARFADASEAQEAVAALRIEAVALDAVATVDRDAAAYVGEASALAVVRLRGARPVVARLVDRIARSLAAGSPDDAPPELLADVVDIPQRARITLRVSAPENAMRGVLASSGRGLLRYDGTGIAFLVRERADASWVLEQRKRVERAFGSVILERGPAPLRVEVDTWGTPALPLSLARRIKTSLDPRSTLSPGRFAGGI